MAYSVTFKRGDQVLERYEFEVENPDDIRAHVDEAHAKFRKAHPNISIFDGGIAVHYDKDRVSPESLRAKSAPPT